MASVEHWTSRRERLFDPRWGAVNRVPMEQAALVGQGPGLAVHDVLELMVLGLHEEASELLEFVPRLQSAVADPATFAPMAEHRRYEAAAYLREYLLVGAWLKTHGIDQQLADDAYTHLVQLTSWWGGTPTGPNLLHLMLLSLEAGHPDRAIRDYERYEKKSDRDLTPSRLARNARALLFAHAEPNPELTAGELTRAVERFRMAATKWEKGVQPLPYVDIVTLARILRACGQLRGEALDMAVLLRKIA